MTPNATMKTRRAELGLTQRDVARLAGCSKQWVSRIEQGRADPSVVMAGRLSRVLSESVGTLFPAVFNGRGNEDADG